jgi:DNA-directed RNA polymerase subunit H
LGKTKKKKEEGREITIDVLAHKLVPKMRILSEKEKAELLEKYNVDETKLPKMYVTDPAAKQLGAKVGDVIEIKRNDLTGNYNFYRLVIEYTEE